MEKHQSSIRTDGQSKERKHFLGARSANARPTRKVAQQMKNFPSSKSYMWYRGNDREVETIAGSKANSRWKKEEDYRIITARLLSTLAYAEEIRSGWASRDTGYLKYAIHHGMDITTSIIPTSHAVQRHDLFSSDAFLIYSSTPPSPRQLPN